MIIEETEHKLQQAIALLTKLINKPTDEVKEMAIKFIDENIERELPPIGYDGSFLTGNPDELPF